MSPADCTRDFDADGCVFCPAYADCLDATAPLEYVAAPPLDGPLKMIADYCTTHRHHDYPSVLEVAR